MHTWIALLRGINVGGHHPLPMRDLVAHLDALQLKHIQTYIQSGNAVFRTPRRRSPAALEKQIADRIEEHHGFRPRVLLLTADALERAANSNPFPEGEAEPKTLHLSFLASPAVDADHATLAALRSPTERYHLADAVFYLHAPDGIGRSKLAAKTEQLLGVPATARNWRTIQKLRDLASEVDDLD